MDRKEVEQSKEAYSKPPVEVVMSDETIARVRSLLGSQGLYDCSDDTYDNPNHPDDDRWIVRGSE